MVTGSGAPLFEIVTAWHATVFGRRSCLFPIPIGAAILLFAFSNFTIGVSYAQAPNSRNPAARLADAAQISDARVTADALFGDRCAVCHGSAGDGNGPGAANLNPKPIDFHNRKWQHSVSDENIAKAIVYGGPAVGLSASMSANPDLENRPDVVAALIERIRKTGGGAIRHRHGAQE